MQVATFLDTYHPDKYHVFNVSERTYDASGFHGRVSNYNWQHDHAPPLHLLFNLVDEMYRWLKRKYAIPFSDISV